ncbi:MULTISPECIES: hypothetical protein [Streptomyces]|uniref:HEAT repeat domain-containing protein n=1 Tax=Streptomyces changanensis TaxID=2964669 RepID=A0ABY5N6F8_9ACTN|nr:MULTISPECIES: hypothetical protein [Streptomyces]UUS31874.1 hypothetical protein NRO40_14300 [Streptomyces changanensis]
MAPAEVLSGTAWSTLEHAYGTAQDVPQMLQGLMDTDLRVRSESLSRLHHVVHHQNTLYTATAPAAMYVAGILGDARTLEAVEKGPHGFSGPMRAELLGWLDSVADAADDEAAATSRRFGFPPEEYPPFVAICRIRPQLFHAVSAFLDDPDTDVRAAAVSACIPLLDDPHLIHLRDALAPMLRNVLATSEAWKYQERAIDALASWGHDTTGSEVLQERYAVCDAESEPQPRGVESQDGYDTAPPF